MNPTSLTSHAVGRPRVLRDPTFELPRHVARLTNGRYSVELSGVGSGLSQWNGLAVSRWTPDRTTESDGFHIYVRDLEDGLFWSAGFQPTRVVPRRYEFRVIPGVAEIVRADREIETQLAVCVASTGDFELRHCRLTNLGERSRRIELTSYVEFVLGGRDADASHPAFSKLFIETELDSATGAILARRRPRGSDDPEVWGFHRLVSDDGAEVRGGLEFETNRAQFLGRGQTLSRPRALEKGMSLSGGCGAVLDPIGSLRTSVSLEPGETREVVFLLGAGQGRESIEELAAAVRDLSHARAILDAAATTNGDLAGSTDGELHTAAAQQWIVHPSHRTSGVPIGKGEPPLYVPASAAEEERDVLSAAAVEPLQFENGFGGFSADGREYVIRLRPDGSGGLRLPPRPWTNVLANERGGCVITERGAGYTWAGNSRHNRLTAWHNDPVCDPHAEAFWIRDEDAETFWSPLPGPTPDASAYEVRHGFGYTTFRCDGQELAQEATVLMAPDDPVKLVRLRLVNRGGSRRRLSLFSYVHWALGSLAADSAAAIATEYDPALEAILARNPGRIHPAGHVAFSAPVWSEGRGRADISHTGDRTAFLGLDGVLEAPAAVTSVARLDDRTGAGLDPCAAWQLPVEIPAGGTFECTFLLGEAPTRDDVAELIRRYREPGAVDRALEQVTTFWRQTLAAVQIETPSREIDLLVNGWLPYQNLCCRLWARSAYYQPGGAYGFRDQLQDAAALVYHRPDLTREQILRNASQQFVEGDVMHWWHGDTGYGLRTRFSDDLLWLPLVTAEYVRTTGDDAVLDEQTPFLAGRLLAENEQEHYQRGEQANVAATVYEHCCRALDRGLTIGVHGLPLIGCGDWNDGMSRIGQAGKGESVWLGFFIHAVLERMLPICRRRGDHARAERYAAFQSRLAAALNEAGWDGQWYRRAYYDNGEPLGSADNDECQIDALAQAWAVLSGVAPDERVAKAVRAVEERLVSDDAGMIRLLTPSFDRTTNDPGYIKGYLPGIRENGGQYTHGVLWFVRAMAELGRGSRAVELLTMLSPIARTATKEQVAVYQTEPYVVAADVYGEPPHVGRGGWTWYTGSAGWMWRVAVESILGLSVEKGQTLVLKPAISSAWPKCRLHYRLPGGETTYDILIENPADRETGVTAAKLDGRPVSVENGAARCPLQADGKHHEIIVQL